MQHNESISGRAPSLRFDTHLAGQDSVLVSVLSRPRGFVVEAPRPIKSDRRPDEFLRVEISPDIDYGEAARLLHQIANKL